MIECRGFKRSPHDVGHLKAKGLCRQCYLRKWNTEHKSDVIRYQREYHLDPAYREINAAYMREYRRTH